MANDVETEQIAFMGFDWRSGYPIVSSAVQVCLTEAYPHVTKAGYVT